jgi:acetyl-CoA carboxylase carboxyltransferase component
MKALSCTLILALLAGGHAYANCSYPKAPEKIPDGATATMAEMVQAQKAVKAYNDDIKAYTECLKQEHDQEKAKADADKNVTQEQKDEMEKVLVQKNNAAVDEAQAITDRFNEQVRIFKAKSQK